MQPKVSVIIPVYNTEKYLRQCLDSVVNQTLKEIEIICIDDCSNDGSSEIIELYANIDKRIKVIRYTDNKSASQARKDGVLMASGEYVMFLDADDTYEMNACDFLYNKIKKENVDILQFGTYVDVVSGVSKESYSFFQKFVEPYLGKLTGKGVFNSCFLEKKYRFNLWNKIYSTALCKKAFSEIKDGSFPKAQDLYASFIILYYANSYLGIDEKLYHYNYGRGITGGAREMTLKEFRRILTQSIVIDELKSFLFRINKWHLYSDAWFSLKKDLISECISHWIKHLVSIEKGKGFDLLVETWGKNAIDNILKERFSSYYSTVNRMFYSKISEKDLDAPNGYLRVVPIVFATNSNYACYAAVAIQSIVENAKDGDFYRVYVLHDSLDNYLISRLEKISVENVVVRCINVSEKINEKNTELHIREHFSKEMYYRLIIPEIMPFYNKVIYLDCDLVVKYNVAELLDVDIKNCYIAAVKNKVRTGSTERLSKDFGIEANCYVNSGVLVFNVREWISLDLCNKCFNLVRETPKEKLKYADQDVINAICKNHIYYLDELWNFQWNMLYGDKSFSKLCSEIITRIGADYRILHFTSNIKPWNHPYLEFSNDFWRYARQTDFYEQILLGCIQKNTNVNNNAAIKPIRANNKYISLKESNFSKVIRCYKQHGMKYTVERIVIKLCEEDDNTLLSANSETHSRGKKSMKQLIKNGIRCYEEHGLRYTLKRVLHHLGFEKRAEEPKRLKKTKKDYDYYLGLKSEQYEEELKLWFKERTGKELDLENPKTFNEKIQWMKLYDSTPLKTLLADKYLVREWVKEKIGKEYLIPLLGVYDSFDEIDFEELPNQFALKTNHGSGWNIIVHNVSDLDKKEAKKKFDVWLQKNYAFNYGMELHYMNIPPKIICEKYMADLADGDIYDYRFFCFNGVPKFVWVDIGSGTNHHKRNVYDVNWTLQNYKVSYPNIIPEPEKPENFNEMLECVKKLCAEFAFVRVDFYSLKGKAYFGEMTFTPQSGTGKWEDEKQNELYGKLIKLPEKSPFPKEVSLK